MKTILTQELESDINVSSTSTLKYYLTEVGWFEKWHATKFMFECACDQIYALRMPRDMSMQLGKHQKTHVNIFP